MSELEGPGIFQGRRGNPNHSRNSPIKRFINGYKEIKNRIFSVKILNKYSVYYIINKLYNLYSFEIIADIIADVDHSCTIGCEIKNRL